MPKGVNGFGSSDNRSHRVYLGFENREPSSSSPRQPLQLSLSLCCLSPLHHTFRPVQPPRDLLLRPPFCVSLSRALSLARSLSRVLSLSLLWFLSLGLLARVFHFDLMQERYAGSNLVLQWIWCCNESGSHAFMAVR